MLIGQNIDIIILHFKIEYVTNKKICIYDICHTTSTGNLMYLKEEFSYYSSTLHEK